MRFRISVSGRQAADRVEVRGPAGYLLVRLHVLGRSRPIPLCVARDVARGMLDGARLADALASLHALRRDFGERAEIMGEADPSPWHVAQRERPAFGYKGETEWRV